MDDIKYSEKYRPQFHYTTLDSWVNDPNGLVYFNGLYHLYYQSNPHVNVWGNMTWGHAVSKDLIHWEEKGFSLFPDDVGTMFSGTAVVDKNNTSLWFSNLKEKKGIVIAYSTNTQHIGIAYSLDGGNTFIKISETKPVIENPGVNDFRDPHIFYNEDIHKWNMVIAGGILRIYESEDLKNWKFCSKDESIQTECPNLLKFYVEETGEYKWVLSCGGRGYYVGSFDGKVFKKESEYISMCEGPDVYAGITFDNDPEGRINMISWLNNWTYSSPIAKWNGGFSLPVTMKLKKLGSSYRLIQTPSKEVSLLDKEILKEITNTKITNKDILLSSIQSNIFKFELTLNEKESSDFTFSFLLGEKDEAILSYNKESSTLTFNRTNLQDQLQPLKDNGIFAIPLSTLSIIDNKIKIEMYVDVDSVEIFINEGFYYFVSRVMPFSSSKNMKLTTSNELNIEHLKITQLHSIYFKDEKPSTIHTTCSDKISLKLDDTFSFKMASFNDLPILPTLKDPNIGEIKIEKEKVIFLPKQKGTTHIVLKSKDFIKEIEVVVE